MCCMYRKRSKLFSLISIALFVALNTEVSECVSTALVIQHRLIKFSSLKPCLINDAEMNERMSKLSL